MERVDKPKARVREAGHWKRPGEAGRFPGMRISPDYAEVRTPIIRYFARL